MQSNWNDVNHPGTLLTVNQYNALGQAQQATLGNGIVRNLQYDNRGRMTSLTDGSLYSFTLGYAPDNSILTGNDSINGNWAYIYDDFARLATSNKNSGLQTFNYKYDRYANRWQQNAPQGGPAPQYSFDANNRISGSGVVYDAAGNITNDGLGNSYTYDAEDRLLTVSGTNSASYVYDGLNKRVRATVGSNTNDYIFDQSGRAITHLVPSWHRSELYARGLHVATYVNNTTYFEHSDWLVTVRARSDVSGTRVETCTSLAFGDAQGCTGTDWSPLHFTGTESDSESNLQHFLFRQFSTTEGRWLSPDPAGLAAVNPSDPQSWNRYAYVNNNPLSFTDPTGLKMCPECHFLGGAGMGATCNLDGVSASCGEVQALMDAGATQYTFYISGTGSNRNGVSTSFGFNCNVDPGSGSVDCPGTSALPAPGGNPYWSNNAIAEILGIPSAFNLPLAGMSTLPSPLSLQQRQPVTASVRAYRPAGPVAKPGAVECITNPGDSLEALAPNANQPSADPGFPSLIYANGSGRQQLNPEGDAFGAGVAVIGDYLLAAFSCLMRR